MNRSEVISELQSIVLSERQRWKREGAWDRALDAALRALSDCRPLSLEADLSLKAGQRNYPLPDCVFEYQSSDWGSEPKINQWDARYPGPVPRAYTILTPMGKQLEFAFAPRLKHLAAYGGTFTYRYKLLHILTEEDCTLTEADEPLFYIRALAALMQELMVSNVVEPIQLQQGTRATNLPESGTPAAVYNALMQAYREQC